ncbi:MAG: FUSC family protein [Ferruginibacter sp.]|nr:FUSC family protein [Ferruginibacter sp.]
MIDKRSKPSTGFQRLLPDSYQVKENTQNIRYFLFSQYLADGIRITVAIVLPALLFAQFASLNTGLLISTGALCVSISDAPGPLEHKRNGMAYCIGFVLLMTLLTGFANHHVLSLGLLIVFASFVFSMFAVFGTRASSVGTAALLIMILNMDKVMPAGEVLQEALLILCGGVWYMAASLLFYLVRPFRQAQRSLGNCIHETSRLLLIKAALYDPGTNVDTEYQKLLAQQVIVSEKQDETRELLFKGKAITKDSTRTGQALLITFTNVVDLYEQVIATWYDYPLLRKKFSSTGILPAISVVIREIAYELDEIGLAIQSNIPYKKEFELIPALNELKSKIDALKIETTSNLVLKKILVNLRNIGERVNEMPGYFAADSSLKIRGRAKKDYSKFVTHQEISFAVFRDNLNLNSSVFRHALRMMITCILGFIILQFISYGHHSYWILLTIVFILKPAYSITKQRNVQRIAGTLAGGVLGIVLIATIADRAVLLAIMVFLMIGTYTFQRVNYTVTVLFMTPYILVLFRFLGLGFINIVEERVLDTAIASVLAFFSSYFLFPHWESKQLEAHMASVLKANISYLKKLKYFFSGDTGSLLDYKLVRKELYVSTANLSAALYRMLSEPKNKQENAPEINEFVVLNNVLSSNIASLFSINTSNEQQAGTKEILQPLNRSFILLEESLQMMDRSYQPGIQEAGTMPASQGQVPDQQMKEHVDFIYKLAVDIKKVVQKINAH